MEYNVSSPEEYLEALEEDWRKPMLMQIRAMLLDAADDITDGINYKMLSFSDSRGTFCHLNAQKKYVALYVGNAAEIDVDGTLLKGINCGKGCVRFKKTDDVGSENITRFVQKVVQTWKDGIEFEC